MTFVPILPLGGQYARIPEQGTASGGRRSTRGAFNIAAIAPDADLLTADRAWVRALWDELPPQATDSGGYANFLGDDDKDRVQAAYGSKYARLAAVKAR